MSKKLLNIGNFRPSGDVKQDLENLIKLVARLEDWVASNIPQKGVSGTFVSANDPLKTIKVENGVVVEIK